VGDFEGSDGDEDPCGPNDLLQDAVCMGSAPASLPHGGSAGTRGSLPPRLSTLRKGVSFSNQPASQSTAEAFKAQQSVPGECPDAQQHCQQQAAACSSAVRTSNSPQSYANRGDGGTKQVAVPSQRLPQSGLGSVSTPRVPPANKSTGAAAVATATQLEGDEANTPGDAKAVVTNPPPSFHITSDAVQSALLTCFSTKSTAPMDSTRQRHRAVSMEAVLKAGIEATRALPRGRPRTHVVVDLKAALHDRWVAEVSAE